MKSEKIPSSCPPGLTAWGGLLVANPGQNTGLLNFFELGPKIVCHTGGGIPLMTMKTACANRSIADPKKAKKRPAVKEGAMTAGQEGIPPESSK